MEGGQSMNKGNSRFNSYKGISRFNRFNQDDNNSQQAKAISKDRLDHSNQGEFTKSNRPNGGGHGQDNIDYMDKHKIPYEITMEYNNGVRIGNLPTSKDVKFRTGNNHTWFPKSWTSQDIEDAANYVASTYKKMPLPRASHTGIYKGIKVTIIFGKNGKISTVYPEKDQGGLGND